VKKTQPTKPPRQILITPINVIKNETCECVNSPIIIPIDPVPKNKSIRTLSLCGFTYFIDVAQWYMVLKIDYFLA